MDDPKTLGLCGLLLLVILVCCSGGKTAKKSTAHAAPDGWICDEHGCRRVDHPAPAPSMSLARLSQLEEFYTGAATPAVDLPTSLRQKNWLAAGGGSCVWASSISLLRWPEDPRLDQIADEWARTKGGGESSRSIGQAIEEAGLKYVMTVDGDVELLKWAVATRRGAAISYNGHCVDVMGYDPSTNEAIILDNNHIGSYVRRDWDRMVNDWHSDHRTGNWAFAFVYTPPAPIPIL